MWPCKLMTSTLMTKPPRQPQDGILISDSWLQELLIPSGVAVPNTITEMRVCMYESQFCPYLPCCIDIVQLKMYPYPFFGRKCTQRCVWKSGRLRESVLSFTVWVLRISSVFRLGGKRLYPTSHLSDPFSETGPWYTDLQMASDW